YSSVVRAGVEGTRVLRDFRDCVFGRRPNREGAGLGRRRQELGAVSVAGAGAVQGVYPLPRAMALGWAAGDPAEPRLGRGGKRPAATRAIRGRAWRGREGP